MPRMIRLVIGNSLIMTEMAKRVPDVGSYAPVTVLVDERPDGVHLSYDGMASLLALSGNHDALEVARDLDKKIEDLLGRAATSVGNTAADSGPEEHKQVKAFRRELSLR